MQRHAQQKSRGQVNQPLYRQRRLRLMPGIRYRRIIKDAKRSIAPLALARPRGVRPLELMQQDPQSALAESQAFAQVLQSGLAVIHHVAPDVPRLATQQSGSE